MANNNPTFKDNGKRAIYCEGCGRYLKAFTYLGEKKPRIVKCGNCGSFLHILPPEKGEIDGHKVIFYGAGRGLSTMDLTDADAEATLEPVEETPSQPT